MTAISQRLSLLVLILVLLGVAGCGGSTTTPTDGDAADGDAADGDVADGDTDSDAADGDAVDGDTDSDTTDGDEPDGDGVDGDGDSDPDLDPIDGDVTDRDLDDDGTDGDVIDGDLDSDEPDGDVSDSDPDDDGTDGDTIDGDVDSDAVDADLDIEVDTETDTAVCSADYADLLGSLPYEASHTTENAGDNANTSCGERNYDGQDVIYSLDLTANDLLQVVVDPLENVDLAVYVIAECVYGAACLQLADEGGDATETLRFRPASSGTYFVVVDSSASDGVTPYDIAISLIQPGTAQPGDACTDDADCNPNAGAGSGHCLGDGSIRACSVGCTITGDCESVGFNGGCCQTVAALGGDYCQVAAYCGSTGQGAGPGEACATPDDPNQPVCDPAQNAQSCIANTRDTVAYCTQSCTTNVDCADFTNPCCIATGGPFNLCLNQADCPADCPADELLMLGGTGTSLSGTLAGQGNDVHALSCIPGGTAGEDYSYSAIINGGQQVQITVEPLGDWDPVILLTNQCGWLNSPDACLDSVNDLGIGQSETLTFDVVEGGIFQIVVDSKAFGAGGAYNLDIALAPLADGDLDTDLEEGDPEPVVCEATRTYAREQLPVSFTDTTYGLPNHLYLNEGCGSEQTPAIDHITAVMLNSGDTLYVDLTGISGWNPALMIYSSCESQACELFVDNGLTGQGESLDFTAPADGEYYVVVDSTVDGQIGAFNLALSLDPFTDGDVDSDTDDITTCTADFVVGDFSNLPYTNSSDTTGGVNKVDLAPGQLACFTWPIPGPDHVYAIDLTEGQGIDVLVNSVDGTYDVVIVIADVCNASLDCLGGVDDGGQGVGEMVSGFIAPATGTYYVIIDSPRAENNPDPYYANQAAGPYVVEIAEAGTLER